MKNKCTVIQIDGLRGLLILGFVIMCAIAGFIIFPAWCCQHAWNFIADYVIGMPLMELKHGAILWLIIALVSYVTFFNKFKIAFVSTKSPIDSRFVNHMPDEEILKAIEKRIKEKQEQIKQENKNLNSTEILSNDKKDE